MPSASRSPVEVIERDILCLASEAIQGLDVVMESGRLLPSTVPPPGALEPEQHHRNQEDDVDQGKSQPCVLILDLVAQRDPDCREMVRSQFKEKKSLSDIWTRRMKRWVGGLLTRKRRWSWRRRSETR